MLRQICIRGAWLPLIFGYLSTLDFKQVEQLGLLDAFPVAAIVGFTGGRSV